MERYLRNAARAVAPMVLALTLGACMTFPSPEEPSAPAQEASVSAESSEGAASESPGSSEETVLDRINLNDMTREQLLETIPDFGSRMVREFFEYQPYVSIQQFRREIGKYVDDEQVAFYEAYIYVPVDVNDSDAETLKQIPGLDDDGAQALMAARPFDSNEAFLEGLSAFVDAEQLQAAATYLNE